jgi:hypothetical protein
MPLYAGIDPGRKGAIVIIDDDCRIVDRLCFALKGGDSLVHEWECGVLLFDEFAITRFLTQYNIESIAIECPMVTTYGGHTAIKSLADLRGNVTQLYTLAGRANAVRRLVYPVSWQSVNKIPKLADRATPNAFKKHLIKTFEERYPDHGCKYAYELEGVADAWFIARWAMIQSKLENLENVA